MLHCISVRWARSAGLNSSPEATVHFYLKTGLFIDIKHVWCVWFIWLYCNPSKHISFSSLRKAWSLTGTKKYDLFIFPHFFSASIFLTEYHLGLAIWKLTMIKLWTLARSLKRKVQPGKLSAYLLCDSLARCGKVRYLPGMRWEVCIRTFMVSVKYFHSTWERNIWKKTDRGREMEEWEDN